MVPELNATYKFKLDDNLTVYSSGLIAILMALRWANRNKLEKLVIYRLPEFSTKQNSGKSRTRQDVLDQILREISIIVNKKVDINKDWCPSHCNVAGNEMTDEAAKRE